MMFLLLSEYESKSNPYVTLLVQGSIINRF